MAKNENLHTAKVNANDEFYTQYSDIANELGHYREHFKGKTVYCNCDDPTWSNFWRFFHNNFSSLGLKKLISTHYQKDTEPSYALIYEGGDDFNMDAGKVIEIRGNYAEVNGKQVFYTAGDFRSDARIELLEEADICVTNPPWSLFRKYIANLIEHNKIFVVLGSINTVTYKDFFPLIKENKVRPGYSFNKTMEFIMPDEYLLKGKAYIDKDGKKHGFVPGVCWYTNLDISKHHDGLWHRAGKFDQTQAHKYYEGNESKYPKYDNYDAIEVSKTKDIPIDYAGVMGVPITWLDKYNPEEFEIIELGNSRDNFTPNKDYINPKKHTKDGRVVNGGAINCVLAISQKDKPYGIVYYTSDNSDYLVPPYARILIRNRNPIAKKDDLGY
ncbi:MAG: adenine methyltransferase [Erysipelotrichaceae bacterium]|nr:adenine methyltransferase [Erysipelotrichaceae bacterium]